jgi:hypothetical protein
VRRLAVRMLVDMRVFMPVIVIVVMVMVMAMGMLMFMLGGLALDPDFAGTAAASCAH